MRLALRPFAPSLLLATLVALTAGACQQLPVVPGRGVTVLDVGPLEAKNPNDILVAPLEYAEEGIQAPDRPLRQAFVNGLVRRRYAPLGLDYVDARAEEASFPLSAAGADAVLRVLVRTWDDSLWDGRKAIVVDLEVSLLDPADPLGSPLWAGRLDRRFDFGSGQIEFASDSVHYQAALDEIASEILSVLPARRTEPGYQ